jgi:nickel-dependent lactate racemase
MILFEQGGPEASLSAEDLRQGLHTALGKLGRRRSVLIVPPDITRLHSCAGELTRYAYEYDPPAVSAVMPALGTHCPMSPDEIESMFGGVSQELFKVHNWRTDCTRLGELSSELVRSISEGASDFSVPFAVNREVVSPQYDLILSIGQVVPHEVAGMAGHNKNIFVGLGDAESIHRSHFVGATYGIERIMGRRDSPVRRLFDHAFDAWLGTLPLVHVLTVVRRDGQGRSMPCGLFIGSGRECYEHAAELAVAVNICLLERPLTKVVVYLDPVEYRSFWLGNKSVYRTRMAIADGGSLIVLAPGVSTFGEDPVIDRLIRRHGYRGTAAVMKYVGSDRELKDNLGAAAHLIHGSSEGRFSVTYCPGGLGRQEVEKAGYGFAPIDEMLARYDPGKLREGLNRERDGSEIYFIANPGAGLWAHRDRFV